MGYINLRLFGRKNYNVSNKSEWETNADFAHYKSIIYTNDVTKYLVTFILNNFNCGCVVIT